MRRRASLRVALAGAALAALLVSASSARAQQVEARSVAPPTPEHTAQGELMLGVTGGVLLGLPYAASVWSAAASDVPGDKWLYAPVIGPWGAIVDRTACRAVMCRGNIASDAAPLVVSGLAQAAGLALIVVALTTPTNAPPPTARAGEAEKREKPHATLHVVPASYAGGGGLAAFGTF